MLRPTWPKPGDTSETIRAGPASTASASTPSPTGRRNAWPRCIGSCATGATDPLRRSGSVSRSRTAGSESSESPRSRIGWFSKRWFRRWLPSSSPTLLTARSGIGRGARPTWRCGRCGERSTKATSGKLVSLIAAEISEGRVLHLIRSFLDAGVIEAGKWHPTTTGVPQGGVASPLWSNIFLTPFDRAMTEAGYRLTRWADDFVVVCKTRQEAEAALALADRFLRETLGISLHPEKTRIVHVDHGFEFLGYKVKRGSGLRLPVYKRKTVTNPHNLYAVPREKSVQRFREQIRNLTRRHAPVRLSAMIEVLNPVIRGWGNYYRKANVRTLFHRLDGWIERRLLSFIAKRWRNTAWRRHPTSRLVNEFGLVRLIHLVPGIRIIPRQRRRPHRKAACGKTARAV